MTHAQTKVHLWPDENPLDETLRFEQLMGDGSVSEIMPVAKVIGLARDNKIYRSGHIPPLFFHAPQTAYIGACGGPGQLRIAARGARALWCDGVSRRASDARDGVRMILGARAGQAQMLVVAQGMKLVLIGVLIGFPISMAASQVVSSMLFGLSARGPATYGAVALLLAIAGLTACWIPATGGEGKPDDGIAM